MNQNEYEEYIKKQMCEVSHLMWDLGWVAANDGNISVKINDNTFLATPTGISKRLIEPHMILKIDREGNVLDGLSEYRPSSEIKMHLRCYEERDDVGAVVHAHPPISTGFALAKIPMDTYSLVESTIAIGSVPIAPFAIPSTDEVPDSIAPFLEKHDVLLLENHGALTVGSDLLTTFYRMETLELWAKTSFVARLLQGTEPEEEIKKEDIKTLIDMRANYKVTGRHPGYKKFDK